VRTDSPVLSSNKRSFTCFAWPIPHRSTGISLLISQLPKSCTFAKNSGTSLSIPPDLALGA